MVMIVDFLCVCPVLTLKFISRWKKLIENSFQWTLDIDFLTLGAGYDNNRANAAFNFLMTTNRKFNDVTITDVDPTLITVVIAVLKKHGSSVVYFKVNKCNLADSQIFIEILRLLPNLKKLTLCWTLGWTHESRVPSIGDIPKLISLETFELISSDFCFAKCVRNSALSTIKIECTSFEKEPVVELLRCQQHLTRLNLYVANPYQFFVEAMPFKLTHLFLPQIKPKDVTILLKFLKSQTTIEALVLEAGSDYLLPNFIYEFILSNFQNLKSLRLDTSNIPIGMDFYKKTAANRSIENLMLLNSRNSEMKSWFPEFIKHTPNIKDLTIHSYWTRKHIECLAINLNKLKRLSVAMFSICKFDGTRFPKLNSLKIDKFFGDSDMWVKFIEANSQIKELTVEFLCVPDVKDFVQQTTTILKLHSLRIGVIMNFSADKCFFDIIRKNCSKLQALDLPVSCFIQSELSDINVLQFHDSNYNYRSHEDAFYERLSDIFHSELPDNDYPDEFEFESEEREFLLKLFGENSTEEKTFIYD